MPQQPVASIQNSFTKGLLTEFTGLNFPENAATDTDNCEYTLIGDVTRRLGINYETNFATSSIDRDAAAVNSYKWNNAGGDGETQVMVVQLNGVLHFWRSSSATVAAPMSNQILASTVDMSAFVAAGGTFDKTLECQFSDGNGYLFVVHPSCEPIYCTYNAGTITGNIITVSIRDFSGIVEPGVPVNFRPSSLSDEHAYNLTNQGWTSGNIWSADSTTSINVQITSRVFTVPAGITGVVNGTTVAVYFTGSSAITGIPNGPGIMVGTVTGYSGTSMTINVTAIHPGTGGLTGANWLIVPKGASYLSTWNTAVGNYPSNADVWWYFKNASGVFDPATTTTNVSIAAGNAPRGHYILNAFSQQRDVISGLGVTDIITTARPSVTTWFQGRVWYSGLNAQQPATGDAGYYTWTENIYFSQIVTDNTNFGNCYQVNDPTSETLFDLLPTDGGVITIQGCGAVFKLFPIQNGLLVFAANGIWFVTGSQGIGFSANDYTITKLSGIQSISSTSFVDVNGLPYFWNEEGIYSVQAAKSGGLEIDSITVGTIASFYDDIPRVSKKYVRGAYHPIDYVIQWIYRDTSESNVTNRYQFNKILNYNTYNKAFFPYTVPVTHATINGINYVSSPGDSSAPSPAFKYLTTTLSPLGVTFSDEHDETFKDFVSDDGGTDYTSYFVTGYQIRGQAQKIFFPGYVYVFTRTNAEDNAYRIQGIWDYANNRNSNRWSSLQYFAIPAGLFDMVYKKHKIRGHGLALQFKITSVPGMPFDIIGWSSNDNVNTGI